MKKRIASIIMVALLASAMAFGLCACGSNDDATSEETAVEQTAASEESASEGQEAVSTESKAASTSEKASAGKQSSNDSKAEKSTGKSSGKSAESKSSDSSQKSSKSSGSSGKSSEQPQPAPKDDGKFTVHITIDGSAGGRGTLLSKDVSLEKGSTVYDALVACGIGFSGSADYISAIGGLAEFDCGETSGWMYSVNGDTPMTPCGSKTLKSGDSVRWYYVTEMGSM